MSVRRFLFRITLIGSPILGGVVLAAWLVAHRDAPETREQAAPPTPVSVIVASEVPYTPRATGFGEARPARTWRAAPQVAGEIVEKHPELASGALLAEGADAEEIGVRLANLEDQIERIAQMLASPDDPPGSADTS